MFGSPYQQPILDTNGDGTVDSRDTPASVYRSSADGRDVILLGTKGAVSIQSSTGHRSLMLGGRKLERTWRQIMVMPK